MVGQDKVPCGAELVSEARHAAKSQAAKIATDDDDDTDYSRYVSFKFPVGVPTHPPTSFNLRDVNWTQE